MKRVCIYARVSTDHQETDNQLAQMRRFAESQNWEIHEEYIDHESGKHANRLQFRAMFDAAARREFDIVLFWALDRLSGQGPLATLQHLNLLSGYGVAFRSFEEPYLDTCGIFKDAVIAILGTIAKQERLRISERVKTGRPVGRPRAVLHRDQVAELRAQGLSWPQIARKVGASVRTVRRTFQTPTTGTEGS